MQEESFRERLDALVGTPLSGGGPAVAPDPVNQPMIRLWVTALEDRIPVYTDAGFATASRFGGIVAPPLMLLTWTIDLLGRFGIHPKILTSRRNHISELESHVYDFYSHRPR